MRQHKICIITNRDNLGWTCDATVYVDGKGWRRDTWNDENKIDDLLEMLEIWYERAGHKVLEKHVHLEGTLRLLASNYVRLGMIDDSHVITDKAPEIYAGSITTDEEEPGNE